MFVLWQRIVKTCLVKYTVCLEIEKMSVFFTRFLTWYCENIFPNLKSFEIKGQVLNPEFVEPRSYFPNFIRFSNIYCDLNRWMACSSQLSEHIFPTNYTRVYGEYVQNKNLWNFARLLYIVIHWSNLFFTSNFCQFKIKTELPIVAAIVIQC